MATATDKFYIRSKDNNNVISFEKLSGAESEIFSPIYIQVLGSEELPQQTQMSSRYNVSLNTDMVIEIWSYNSSLKGMHIIATKNIEIGGNIMSLVAGNDSFSTWTLLSDNYAFSGIFKNNIKLVDASDLYIPEDLQMNSNCFESMFEGCTALTVAPVLTPLKLKGECYKNMFKGCTSLVEPPSCSATKTAMRCFEGMFDGCSELTSVMPVVFEKFYNPSGSNPSNLKDYGYEMAGMYKNCKKLRTGYGTLDHGYTVGCYLEMYYGCSILKTPDNFNDILPQDVDKNHVSTLKSYCCKGMYQKSGVESIKIPSAPIELAEQTYIVGLYNEPELVTRVSTNQFENMYRECTGLTTCTGLTASDPLVFGNIIPQVIQQDPNYYYNGVELYLNMFLGCINITTVNISFGKLNTKSAQMMFLGCTKLTSITLAFNSVYKYINDKNVLTYASNCCESMFENCTGLKTITANSISFPAITYKTVDGVLIPYGGVSYGFCSKMFKNCGLQTVNMSIPFANNENSKNIFGDKACENMFQNCTDLTNINNLVFDGYLGNNSLESMFSGCTKLENVNTGTKTILFKGRAGCVNMFSGCTKLKNVSALSIQNLTTSCCESMFSGCTALQTPPSGFFNEYKYPAACYKKMFYGCTTLKTMPDIYGDTTLKIDPKTKEVIMPEFYDECFSHMFDGCTNLEKDFNGIYGKFGKKCCEYMFNNCRKLKSVRMIKPILSISNSDMEYCFSHMFDGCTALNILQPANSENPDADAKTRVPVIDISEAGAHNKDFPSPTIGKILGERVFEYMFKDCTSLTEEPIIYTGDDENILAYRSYGKYCFAYMYTGCNKMKANIFEFTNRALTDILTGQKVAEDAEDIRENYRVIRKIKGNSFNEYCFTYMYNGCTLLTTSLSIIGFGDNSSLGKSACESMYNSCTNLTEVPNINVNKLKEKALSYMCNSCQNLNTLLWTSGITAVDAEDYSMQCAFKLCTNLRKMIPLYIKNYGPHACEEMFMQSGITTLGTSFATAEKVDKYSFYKMFESCTQLTSLANSIIPGAYINYLVVTQSALIDPSGIESKPKYTYTINGTDYNYFYGTLSNKVVKRSYIEADIMIDEQKIQRPPKIALSDYTFGRMFYGCTSLTMPPPKMNNVFFGNYSCYKMFANTKLYSLPELTPVKYEAEAEPGMMDDGWEVRVLGNSPAGTTGNIATTPDGKIIYKLTTTPLIDELAEGAFCGMFMNTEISSLPNLYAKKFGKNAANSMFRNCQSLQLILSVKFNINEGDDYAFAHMFDNCRNLKFAATAEMGLETTNLFKNLIRIGKYGFCGMFMNCNSLDKLMTLPETITFMEGTCSSMYMNCTSLTGRIEYDFSGNTLGANCFMNMFRNCSQIIVAIIKLGNVSDIKRSCCENMFMSCYGITVAKLEVLLVSKEALDKASTSQSSNSNKFAFCHMFYDCTSLNDFWSNLYIPWSFELTLEWLDGVSETGTYHYNNILDSEKIVRDTSSVPQGWRLTVGYDVKGEDNGE